MTIQINKSTYNKKVFEMAHSNHLWLNAFLCVNPTDDLKIKIGEWVLSNLKDKSNLMPSEGITSENEAVRDLAELTPILYLSVNKS